MNMSPPTGPDAMQQLDVLWEKQSYTSILYLLASFPLGLAYFVFLVSGIAIGLATLIVWIGALILIFMMGSWWQIAAFERRLALQWLHIAIPPLSYPSSSPMTGWQRLQAQIKNPMTWKTLTYLLLKFPLGIFCFIVTLVLLLVSFAIALVSCVIGLITTPVFALIGPFQNTSHALERLQRYLLFACTGFGLGLMTLSLLNQLALLAGHFAQSMLCMSDSELRLHQAQEQAAQARLKAEQAEQRRRQLVVNVSHELRTPVASIAGHLESLLLATKEGTTTPPPDVLYNYLRIAHQEAGRLGMLVDELLSLARMESDELTLEIKAVAVREVIEEVYQVLGPLAQRERQVMLVRGAVPNLPPVLADRQRLIQVLLNLVRNAITSTPAGGIVSINLEPADPQHLALIVADNGIGIAEKDLEHIFERFYRADASRNRASGGFGLGLAIVHSLVTAMGGTISVESAVGQGSRFCVQLQIATTMHLSSPSKNRTSLA